MDYRERLAAAGRFAGGFLKREGRPTTKEILTARLTDRPLRPLFPKGYKDELQIQANVMAVDGQNDPDVLTITGASAALMISPVPFQGPIAGVRVGLIDGNLILMPTSEQLKTSDLDLVVAGSEDSVLMIEGFGKQIPEAEMVDAIMFAHKPIQSLCEMQVELRKKAGVEAFEFTPPTEHPFLEMLRRDAYGQLRQAKQSDKKAERHQAAADLKAEFIEKLFPEGAETTSEGHSQAELKEAFYQVEHQVIRDLIIEGKRLDGRTPQDLRDVSCEATVLPRVHGSAVFTRGETQSLATVTLGTSRDQQRSDGLFEETSERFMLHYYFPSFSVGEVRPIRGPGRREIGHGMLAQRSVEPVLPPTKNFPTRCGSFPTFWNPTAAVRWPASAVPRSR